MLHHPFALEDLLLHSFEPGLHGSRLLGPWNIPDVEHPLTHLNGLSKRKEKGVGKVLEGGTTHLGALGRAGAPWCIVPSSVAFLVISNFPNFYNIPILTENIFADFLESVYLPYHIPPLFQDCGVFQKVSFTCSSGVMVWIILLSTLIGVPEI
jgi:hypothetical protein